MNKYNLTERRNTTVNLIQDKGQVSVTELSDLFNVSEVTVRKDLEHLEKKKVLIRTHGGAMQRDYIVNETYLDEKSNKHAQEKRRIGKAAADLIEDGDTVLMGIGSTVMQVARHIRGKSNLTVIASTINVAAELIRIPDVNVVMIGGDVHSGSTAVIGPLAERMIGDFFCEKFIFSGVGFDLEFGVAGANSLEAHLQSVLIESAVEAILLIDSSKFGHKGLSRICRPEKISKVVTDNGISADARASLEEYGIPVIAV